MYVCMNIRSCRISIINNIPITDPSSVKDEKPPTSKPAYPEIWRSTSRVHRTPTHAPAELLLRQHGTPCPIKPGLGENSKTDPWCRVRSLHVLLSPEKHATVKIPLFLGLCVQLLVSGKKRRALLVNLLQERARGTSYLGHRNP